MSRPHARLRLACAVVVAGFGTLLGAAPALAAPAVAAPTPAGQAVSAPAATTPAVTPIAPTSAPAPTGPDALTPLVDCVQDAPLGAVASRTVVLGYRSTASAQVTAAAGSGANDVTAAPADRGQPSTFDPGEHHGVWLLTVDAAAEPDLTWRLGSAEVRFDGAPACTAATAVTVSAPASAVAGGVVSVSAAVSRLLLAAPSAGAVAFQLDGGAAVTIPVSAGGVARADLPVSAAGPHTVTAAYQPPSGSGLLTSTGTASFTASAASAPLSIAADSVVAGSTSVLVTVARPSAEGAATVDVMTADGTAQSGTDYAPVTTTVALADGQSSSTMRIALPPRAAGAPAATFFVLLQRASTGVSTAAATVRLPAVPAAPVSPASASGTHSGQAAVSVWSVLPPDDPTAATPASTASVGQDLAMLVGGILLTAGGIFGVIGLVRAAGIRDAKA